MSRNQPREQKLLDIVIPVYGRFDLLTRCLRAIPEAAQSITYNVVLVDNASPDAGDFYDSLPYPCVVIQNKRNLGFPKACNQGVRRKQSPLILLLNSDVILLPHAIKYMVMDLDDPSVGVVGAKLLFPSDEDLVEAQLRKEIRPSGKVQHVGVETNANGRFFHIFIGWSSDHPKVNAMRDTYAVTGACLMTRRNIWNRIGGFYEGYGQGTYEDIDFCLSVRALGHNVIVETRAVGIHFTGATVEKYGLGYPMQMNELTFYQRWGNKLLYTEYERW